MRIYISGAMTSDPDYEEKFSAAERWVWRNYPEAEVVNPVRLSRELERIRGAKPDSLPRAEYLKNDIKALLECDRLVAIPGFEESAGAMLEMNIAIALHLAVGQISEGDFEDTLEEYKSVDTEIIL